MQNPFECPSSLSQSLPSSPSARPAEVQIEDYLDHLCTPLVSVMPYEQRQAIRQEVRSHLLVLAAGHEELGSSPAEAIQAAIQQFGDAKEIGRSLLSEYPQPFVLNAQIPWVLLHALIGGFVGSLVFVSMDLMLRYLRLVPHTEIPFDCLVGFAFGWIPAVHLLKRPASPLLAGIKTAGFHMAGITGFLMLASGISLKWFDYTTFIALSTVGISGAMGGGAMSLLFRRLRRFAPHPNSQIAR
ncbi:MAG: hypothetical protein JWN14_4099 [Chthonomonadales bacterium]|nr:hypothetical protein [Chthonomonadales bacterium]